MPSSGVGIFTNPTTVWSAAGLLNNDGGQSLRVSYNLPWYRTSDYADLNALRTAAGAGPYAIIVNSNIAVTANLTLGSGIHLVYQPGCIVTVNTTFTLTIASPQHIVAGQRQTLFTLVGTGAVAFTSPGQVSAHWWGVTGDGVTDDTAILQAVVTAYQDVSLDNGVFKLSDAITITGAGKLTGAGHITASTHNGQGTLIWQSNAAKAAIVLTAGRGQLRSFDVVSELDGVQVLDSSFCLVQDVHVLGGTKGRGFIVEDSVMTVLRDCKATVNGYTARWVNGYAGTMSKGLDVVTGDHTFFATTATEVYDFNCDGCALAVNVRRTATLSTECTLFGGVLESATQNLLVSEGAIFRMYGTHCELGTYQFSTLAELRCHGVGFGTGKTTVTDCLASRFEACDFAELEIQSGSRETSLRDCYITAWKLTNNGIGTRIEETTPQAVTTKFVVGGFNRANSQNLIFNGSAEKWTNGDAMPVGWTTNAANTTIAKEAVLVKEGTYSVKITNAAGTNYTGVKWPGLGPLIRSEWLTVGYWEYVPTGAAGQIGAYVSGVDGGIADAWEYLYGTLVYDTWVWRTYSFYIGAPGSAKRTGSIDLSIVMCGGAAGNGKFGYIDGVMVIDGKTLGRQFVERTGEFTDRFAGADRFLGSSIVPVQAGDPVSTVYTVPTGKTAVITRVVARGPTASLANGTSFSFGSGANRNSWKTAVDLSTMTAATDYMTLAADGVKHTLEAAGATFGVKPVTGATADAEVTVDVFGYEY